METKQATLLLAGVLAVMFVAATGKSVKTGAGAVNKAWPPDFCNGLECPKYKVIDDTHEGWEERLYEESRWVGTSYSGMDFDVAGNKMFMRLFEYIEGANIKGVKIPMAVPVIVKATIDERDATFDRNFTMFFYLPHPYQNATAPDPTRDDVFFSTIPTTKVFVRTFGGYATETKDLFNARALAMDLKDDWNYDHRYLYTAGYNSPWQLFFRHNEIWLVALD